MKKAVLFFIVLCLTGHSLADNKRGFYSGLGVFRLNASDIEGDPIDNDEDVEIAELFAGYRFSDALGIELRYGEGMSDFMLAPVDDMPNDEDMPDSMPEGDTPSPSVYSIGSYQSIYYRTELVNDESKLYALIGYTALDWSEESPNQASDSGSGFSYGLGISFILSKKINLNFEYRKLLETSASEIQGFGINLDYRF